MPEKSSDLGCFAAKLNMGTNGFLVSKETVVLHL